MRFSLLSFLKTLRDKYLYLKRRKNIETIKTLIPQSVSIFSMNCFAGRIYQDLKREYSTPTAGLFFLPQDFVKIGNNIELIKREIEEIKTSKWPGVESVIASHGKYPIGRISGTDIEIHFLHYPSFELACQKWHRRVARFNFKDFLFIGFCQNGWEEYYRYFEDFERIPNVKKILFTQKELTYKYSSIVSIKEFRDYSDMPDPVRKAHIYYKYLIKYLQ